MPSMPRGSLATLEDRSPGCQRCVKRLADDLDHVCRARVGNKNCIYCSKSNSACLKVSDKNPSHQLKINDSKLT